MKSTFKSNHPVTNEAAKSATGKTLDQWFAELDKADSIKLGRREINNRLYAKNSIPGGARQSRSNTKSITTCARRMDCSKDISFARQRRSPLLPPMSSSPGRAAQS